MDERGRTVASCGFVANIGLTGGPSAGVRPSGVATACVPSATEPDRFESVKPIQSTETAIIPLLYLLICGEFVKTSVIQSVELHEYYKIA